VVLLPCSGGSDEVVVTWVRMNVWSGGAVYVMEIYCVKHEIVIVCGCLWIFR
jgi:hypothetical protein